MDLIQLNNLRASICRAFPADPPVSTMTLEAGNDIDSYRTPKVEEASYRLHKNWTEIEDEYLAKFFWGFVYLDSASWKFYLPRFLTFTLDHIKDGSSVVIDSCLADLRPPDRDPFHLASLTSEQVEVVKAFLELVAFDEDSAHRDLALQVLDEGWVENPIYPWREQEKTLQH